MVVHMVAEHDAGALSGVYAEIRTRLGLATVPNVFKAMAAVNHDVLLQNWTAFRVTVLDGILPRVVKEMVGLVISRAVKCEYGIRLHTMSLNSLGVSSPVIQCLLEPGDCALIPGETRGVLRFALSCCQNPERVSPEELQAAALTEDEAQEIMDTVLLVSGLNRFATETGIPAD